MFFYQNAARCDGKNVFFALLDLDLGWPGIDGIQLGYDLNSIYPDTSLIIMNGSYNVKFAKEDANKHSYEHWIKPFQIRSGKKKQTLL